MRMMNKNGLTLSTLILPVLTAGCLSTPTSALPEPTTGGLTAEKPTPVQPTAAAKNTPELASPKGLPDFLYTVRTGYGGDTLSDDAQFAGLRDLGLTYIQGHVSFSWQTIEPRDDGWKWGWTDEVMDRIAAYGLRFISGFIVPKLEGLHWDESIRRDDARFAVEYEEYCYEVVHRYAAHPAWAGIVAVWGGSSDVWGETPLAEPEVEVPLMNACYDGVKRAAPDTIVVGFNMATTFTTPDDWAQWHERAFALSPKFDWFGVQSHGVLVTDAGPQPTYAGMMGLLNVRAFLDEHGFADKPIFLNEGGFLVGEDIGRLSEAVQAEQVVETFIVARTLPVDLRGWVYFEYATPTHSPEDWGLLGALDQPDAAQPRPAWYALQTLIQTVGFFEYQFDARLSGEYGRPIPPFVYQFSRPENTSARLWVIFSPRPPKQEPVTQDVTINIAPATEGVLIDMLGAQQTVTADASGNVTLTSTASPVYLKAGGQ